MGKLQTIALHGFLGNQREFKEGVDIFSYGDPSLGLLGWAKKFNQLTKGHEKKYLLGYSMGGRLACHAAIESPESWKGVIFLSTHLGLYNREERLHRLAIDLIWSQLIERVGWDFFLELWNSQATFSKTARENRAEEKSRRALWASAMRNFSLGRQEPMQRELLNLSIPWLYVVGENDLEAVKRAKMLPQKNVKIIKNAGHRIHLDRPEIVGELYEQLERSRSL